MSGILTILINSIVVLIIAAICYGFNPSKLQIETNLSKKHEVYFDRNMPSVKSIEVADCMCWFSYFVLWNTQ